MSSRGPWSGGSSDDVTCIACGAEVPRSAAREYDKHGNRWERDGKEFEYLCKPCDRDCCHQNRDGLEEALVRAGAGTTDRDTFVRRFCELVCDDAPTERER